MENWKTITFSVLSF